MNRVATRFAVHQLVHWAAVGVMVPVMTLVLREIGLSLLEVGLALAAYSLTTVLLEVPSGALSDLWGRRRTYSLGTASDLLAVVLMLVAPSTAVVIVASALRGAGRAFATGSLDALAIESIRHENPDYDLQLFFSRVGMAVPAGVAVASLAGGFLPELATLPTLGSLADLSPSGAFSVNLLAHGALVALAGALAWTLFDEEAPVAVPGTDARVERPVDEAATGEPAAAGVRSLLTQVASSVAFAFRRRGLSLLLLSSAALGVVLLSVETYWQPRLDAIVESENVRLFGVLGAAYFAVAVLGNAASPLVVRLARGNRAAGVVIARLISAAALVALALQSAAGGFAVAYLAFFLAFTAGTPAQSAMLNELVPDSRRSTLISVSSLMLQLGGFGGSLLFGVISQRFGIGVSWMVAAGVLAASVLLFVPLLRSEAARVHASALECGVGDPAR